MGCVRVRACVCLCSLTLQADGAEARPLFKDAGNDVEAIAAKIEEMYKARGPAVYSHTRACSSSLDASELSTHTRHVFAQCKV